jgi:peptidylprolyl isomerase
MNALLKYLGLALLIGGGIYVGYIHFYHKQETMKRITEKSGLSYEIITPAPADAKAPQKGQNVSVHYTGWIDENGQPGRKFDSSVDRGQQFQFPLGQGYVIAGWDEAVAGMKIGEKRRVYIPSNLAYGARGAGAAIPPHANLIFDIELFGAN